MKAGIIVNPVAGQGKSLKVLPKVRKQLGAHFELEFFYVLTGIKTLLTYKPTRISVQVDEGEVKRGSYSLA